MTAALVVTREFDGKAVRQRSEDGYFDATSMCQAVGKKWADYWRLNGTKDFIQALAESTGIPATDLADVKSGREGGTWVHPDIAIHLAQWCSPRFAVQVSRWVRELMTAGRVEFARPTSGDAILDSIEQTSRALVAIAETRRRQLDLERMQAETRHLAEQANRTAQAAFDTAHGNTGFFTVMGWSRLCGERLTSQELTALGKDLTKLCEGRGLEVKRTAHEKYGSVNLYPEAVLRERIGRPEDEAGGQLAAA